VRDTVSLSLHMSIHISCHLSFFRLELVVWAECVPVLCGFLGKVDIVWWGRMLLFIHASYADAIPRDDAILRHAILYESHQSFLRQLLVVVRCS
jgi:hypothetical protein